MELKININLDNDAFQEDTDYSQKGSIYQELKQIFDDIREDILNRNDGKIWDSNGNTVGEWSITDE